MEFGANDACNTVKMFLSNPRHIPINVQYTQSLSFLSNSVMAKSPISRYAEYLKELYSESASPTQDKFPFTPTTVYVNLTLVKKIVNHDILNEQYKGNVDEIVAVREKIEIDNILEDDTRLVVIEGAAGMGKSTLAWEICRNWDKLESLKCFSLVIFVKLRDEEVQSGKDVSDLLYHSDKDLIASVSKELERKEGEGVLFVFDGFDEFPTKYQNKKSIVMKIIGDRRFFRKATVIVTSRPSALVDLQQFMDVKRSRRIEIVGFSKNEVMEFVSQRLAIELDLERKKNFTTYLSLNPAVQGMMYNPLHCAIVLEVFLDPIRSDRPTIHTQTQLYNELALWLMSRHLDENTHPLARHLPDKLEDLHDETELYQQLLKISKLAFEGMQDQQIIFKRLPEGCSALGLLINKAIFYSQRQEASEFMFFHQTLQEYMSAFYISQLNIEEQRDMFKKALIPMKSVWVFVAGMTSMASIGWGEFTRGSTLNFPTEADNFIIHCIYEAQDLHGCEIDAGRSINYFKLNPTNHYDFLTLGYSIRACGSSWHVGVLGNLSDDSFQMLGLGIQFFESHGGSYSPLTIEIGSQCSPCGTHLKQLLRMPEKILHSVKGLFLLNCSNNKREDFLLLEQKFRLCEESVTVLNITNKQTDISPIFPMAIWWLMGDMTKLHIGMVNQLNKNLSFPDVKPFDFINKHVTFPEEQCSLVKNLASLPSLETLVIHDTLTPGSCGLEPFSTISDNIRDLQYIENLPKHYDYLDKVLPGRPQGVDILTNILKNNLLLKRLKLGNVMTRDEVRDIVDSLKENENLEKLELSIMYHLCFSEQEMVQMDPRVTFPASYVNFNHTLLTKEEEINRQEYERKLIDELKKQGLL